MPYYIKTYNHTAIIGKIYEFDKSKNLIFDERDISEENWELLNGKVYDNTTAEYMTDKAIQDGLDEYAQALEEGFLFDGDVFAVDQPSVIQYTMLAVKLNANAKEPVKVRNKNNNYLSMSAVKYLEFCDKIGTYSEFIENRRIDKVGY